MASHQNIHGRKWGRGIRPWLLLPKYFLVSLVIGGLFAVAILALASHFAGNAEQSRSALILVRAIFRYQVIPATAGAVFFGTLLLLQHPREFLRMRWMRAKLAMVAIAVPGGHLWLSSLINDPQHLSELQPRLLTAAAAALLAFAVIAMLGRLKPRLRQPYAIAQ